MPVGPTLILPNLSLMMAKVTILRMRRRAIRAEMQAAVRLQEPRRNARIRDAARPRSLSRGAARDLRVDRDARSERERARDSREVLRGLEAIHDREGPVGPPTIGDTPNVPPFPNITFGGPLNQRDVNSNRVTGSPRVTERVADVVGRGARDGRLADMHSESRIVRRSLAR